jgi:hypothetical protein
MRIKYGLSTSSSTLNPKTHNYTVFHHSCSHHLSLINLACERERVVELAAAASSTKATFTLLLRRDIDLILFHTLSSEANLDNKFVQVLVLWDFVILHQPVQHPLETPL